MPTHNISETAAAMVANGSIVGLGSGRAARAFVEVLGGRVAEGLEIRGVPTSEETARLAVDLGIPLTTLDDVESIDLTCDGADEFDRNLDLIKGWGGALLREKIVAANSKRLVILVGEEKRVSQLGERGKLPIEVVPFALKSCQRKLERWGIGSVIRQVGGRPFITDNGNNILDCQVAALADPQEFEQRLLSIPGVVETGLFLGMAETILIQCGDRVETLTRP